MEKNLENWIKRLTRCCKKNKSTIVPIVSGLRALKFFIKNASPLTSLIYYEIRFANLKDVGNKRINTI